MTTTTLSKTGARRLAEAEAKIERGLTTFAEVGLALLQIRDERLFRQDHATFEAYIRDRWHMTDRRARQLMDAAEIGTMVPISNERQARELAGLEPSEVIEVFEAAGAEGEVTAKSLAATRARKYPTKGTDDDAAIGKGSPSGAPATAEPSAGEVADESDPAPTEGAPEQAPPAPATVGGVEGYRAAATKARSTVRSHLLTLDPERVIATADEPDHWREFSTDVRGWLDELDGHLAAPHLKAVEG